MRKAILHCRDGKVSFLSDGRRWVDADGDKEWESATGIIQVDLKPWGWRAQGHLIQEILPPNCPCLPQTTKSEQLGERRNSAFIPLQNPGAEVGVGVPDCSTWSSCSWCHQLGKSITFSHSSHCRRLNIEWVWVGCFVTQREWKHPGLEFKIQNFEFWNSTSLNFTANSSPRALAGDWPETNVFFHYYFSVFIVWSFPGPRESPNLSFQDQPSESAIKCPKPKFTSELCSQFKAFTLSLIGKKKKSYIFPNFQH